MTKKLRITTAAVVIIVMMALGAAAHFNLLLAAVSTIPVVATGLAAWQWGA